jgi:hypothetical protein
VAARRRGARRVGRRGNSEASASSVGRPAASRSSVASVRSRRDGPVRSDLLTGAQPSNLSARLNRSRSARTADVRSQANLKSRHPVAPHRAASIRAARNKTPLPPRPLQLQIPLTTHDADSKTVLINTARNRPSAPSLIPPDGYGCSKVRLFNVWARWQESNAERRPQAERALLQGEAVRIVGALQRDREAPRELEPFLGLAHHEQAPIAAKLRRRFLNDDRQFEMIMRRQVTAPSVNSIHASLLPCNMLPDKTSDTDEGIVVPVGMDHPG